MASSNKVTVTVQPTTRRPTAAERRSMEIAALSNHQAKLKQEAADRRRTRVVDPAGASPRKRPVARRRNAL